LFGTLVGDGVKNTGRGVLKLPQKSFLKKVSKIRKEIIKYYE